MQGRYIVLEGGEYVGKSTQSRRLAFELEAQLVFEPGMTIIGREIRSLVLRPGLINSPKTEVLLHAAQRAELAETVIRPALECGRHVVSDRSWLSGAAYQGAQGVEFEDIKRINIYALDSLLHPDLFVLLDADPSMVFERRRGSPDRYEQENIGFHEMVRGNFLELAHRLGGVVIDATAEVEEVATNIRQAVKNHLGL
jgi:dTMP kinase